MKLNECIDELDAIFENVLMRSQRIVYLDYLNINVQKHLCLEQDKGLEYYAKKTRDLYITMPAYLRHKHFVQWQILESYRIVNAALVSCYSGLDVVRENMSAFKLKLELTPYLSELLARIDSGDLLTDVVCSGHGTWYVRDGYVDLSLTNTQVMVYSPPGAKIADNLAVDIENGHYDPGDVVIEHKASKTQYQTTLTPMLFSQHAHSKVPNLCFVDDTKSFPRARIIERMTGRVLHAINAAPDTRNYMLLSAIVEKFPARVIHWGACTGLHVEDQSCDVSRLGFFGYKWKKRTREIAQLDSITCDDTLYSLNPPKIIKNCLV